MINVVMMPWAHRRGSHQCHWVSTWLASMPLGIDVARINAAERRRGSHQCHWASTWLASMPLGVDVVRIDVADVDVAHIDVANVDVAGQRGSRQRGVRRRSRWGSTWLASSCPCFASTLLLVPPPCPISSSSFCSCVPSSLGYVAGVDVVRLM